MSFYRKASKALSAQKRPADGLCTFTGLAELSNPVPGGKPGVILFDATIFVGPSSEKGANPESKLKGKLAYYNRHGVEFYDEATFFGVTFTMANYSRNMETSLLDNSTPDLHFCGDIENLIPMGTVENAATIEDEDGNAVDFPCGHFSIDADQLGIVCASGLATSCDRENGHFVLNLSIYIGGMKKVENIPKTHITSIVLHCYFSTSSNRWGSGNTPTPYDNRYVSVTGRLTGFELATPSEKGHVPRPSKYFIEVNQITFLGSFASGASPSPTQATSITTVPNNLDSPTTISVSTATSKALASAAARKKMADGAAATAKGGITEPLRKANAPAAKSRAPAKARALRSRAQSQTVGQEELAPLSAVSKGKKRQADELAEEELVQEEPEGEEDLELEYPVADGPGPSKMPRIRHF